MLENLKTVTSFGILSCSVQDIIEQINKRY